ncbi:Bromodomain-containing protein [Sporodiniella umbellata]|nr:Bromodomain-containing protein [Sporodiniella umbellata]
MLCSVFILLIMSNVAQKRPYASIAAEETQKQLCTEKEVDKAFSVSERMLPYEKRLCIETLNKLKKHPCAFAFLQPVDPVYFNIPDYFDVIKHPMDLSAIEKKLNTYKSKAEFISDIQLMLDNCYTYNNQTDPVCEQARELEKILKKQIVKLHTPHSNSKKAPVKRSTPKVALPMPEIEHKHCESVIKEFKKPKYAQMTWVFEKPVDARAWGVSDYYDIIKQPMDMATIEKKFKSAEYTGEGQLYDDYKLMFRNCYTYNPPHNEVHLLGKKFEETFDKHWSKLLGKQTNHNPENLRMTQDLLVTPPVTQDEPFSENTKALHSLNGSLNIIPDSVQMFSSPCVDLPIAVSMQGSVSTATFQPATSIHESLFSTIHTPVLASDLTHEHIIAPIPTSSFTQNEEMLYDSNQNLPSSLVHQPGSSTSPTPTQTSIPAPIQSNDGRNVLRIKLNVKNPEEDTSKAVPTKTVVRMPGLALSKNPPIAAPLSKLALDPLPLSPKMDKKEQRSNVVLQNQEKWLAEAKQHALQQQQSSIHQTVKNKASLSSKTIKKTISGPINKNSNIPNSANRGPSVSNSPEPPKTPMFDIGDLYNKINDEKRLRQQQMREEKERFEREDRLRREKERQRYDEQLARKREFLKKMLKKKEADRIQRIEALDERIVDISAQKMSSHTFESTILSKDLDWRELNNWQRETVDYRHIPVPAFVRRSNVNLQELRSKLLNKSVRLKNFKKQAENPYQALNHDSDMDVE